jgi:AbrB family looped-hinge helix DNA binding protein
MSVPSKSSLVVSQRGQITLPSDVRKRFGIKEGAVLMLEERPGELVLRPATVLEVEVYSDEDVARWTAEDALDQDTRSRIKKKVSRRR